MNLTTDFVLAVQEKAQYLNDEKKLLILQIIDNFIPLYDDWDDDDLSKNDLYHIRLGEQELSTGTHGNWASINRD